MSVLEVLQVPVRCLPACLLVCLPVSCSLCVLGPSSSENTSIQVSRYSSFFCCCNFSCTRKFKGCLVQHSPGPRASHRKALSWATTPASNRKHTARHQHQRQTRKNGGIPPTRRGSRSLHDHTPNGHRPYDHNGESPRKAGQRPKQLYTGPVPKRAL